MRNLSTVLNIGIPNQPPLHSNLILKQSATFPITGISIPLTLHCASDIFSAWEISFINSRLFPGFYLLNTVCILHKAEKSITLQTCSPLSTSQANKWPLRDGILRKPDKENHYAPNILLITELWSIIEISLGQFYVSFYRAHYRDDNFFSFGLCIPRSSIVHSNQPNWNWLAQLRHLIKTHNKKWKL